MVQIDPLHVKAQIILLMLLLTSICWGQPVNWHNPIKGKIFLSGTFGELRNSHFHAGIDIKPNNPGPQDILAVADGHVREIRIRGGSYGNALILQHPDGFQSLYGHLERFNPALDSMAYQHQYDQKNFEITLTLDSTVFPVKQGMVIATMGNTGYSYGRHLHFEIRHPSGTMYNPQLFLPDIQDDTPPQFRNLKINYHDDHGMEYKEKTVSVQSRGNGHYTAGNLVLNAFKYSLAVDVVDLHKNTYNRNGIYSLELYRDTSLIFHTIFDSLGQESRKYFPEFIDYISSPSSQAIYYNMRYENYAVDQILEDRKAGLIRPYPFLTQNFKILATDYQNNTSTLTFTVRQVDQPSIDYAVMYNYIIKSNRSNQVNLDEFSIIFPAQTFLSDQRLYIFEEKSIHNNQENFIIHMTKNQLPLYNEPMLIKKSDIPKKDMTQWTLAKCDGDNLRAISTHVDQNYFTGKISQLGSYCLVKDTISPELTFQPINNNIWHIRANDDIHSFSMLDYSGVVDGNWALVEADDKNNRLIFRDFNRYRDGNSHLFQLKVSDPCGNYKIFEKEFK